MHETSLIERVFTELENEVIDTESRTSLRQRSAHTNEVTRE
jgi:hypothetical protein